MSKEELLDNIHKRGFDAFIKDNELIILKDGYLSSVPLDNTLNLFNPIHLPPNYTIQPDTNEVIDMILDNHMIKKEISDGTIVNRKTITWDDIINDINQNKDEGTNN